MNKLLISIYQNLSFTAFILFFSFSIIQLNQRYKLQLNYFLAGLFFTGSYIFLYCWAYSLGILKYIPLLLNTDICFCYLIGPFIFLYYSSIMHAKKFSIFQTAVHFIPFIVSICFVIFINISEPSILNHYNNYQGFYPNYQHNKILSILLLFCDISMFGYSLFTFINVFIFFKIKKSTPEIKILYIFFLLIILTGLIMLIADLTNNFPLILTGFSLYIILPVYYIFFSFKYPEFAIKVIKAVKSVNYKTSISKKYDKELVKSRLLQLMDEDKIFTEPELSLNSLSNALLITPHELSHILNNVFNKNFNIFINSYRIKEAEFLLVNNPEKSIAFIAYSVGFNSASSFYSNFLRATGLSPGDYRKTKGHFSGK